MAGVIVAAGIAAWRAPRQTGLMVLWAMISFAGALAIPLKTTGQSPFYLLVPLYYLAAVLAWTAAGLMEAWPRAHIATMALVAALLVARVAGFARDTAPYLAFAELSRNFRQALTVVSAELVSGLPQALTFHAEGQPRAYMFLDWSGERALARYLAPPGATAEEIAALRRAIDAPAGQGLQVRLRPNLSLESLTRAP